MWAVLEAVPGSAHADRLARIWLSASARVAYGAGCGAAQQIAAETGIPLHAVRIDHRDGDPI